MDADEMRDVAQRESNVRDRRGRETHLLHDAGLAL